MSTTTSFNKPVSLTKRPAISAVQANGLSMSQLIETLRQVLPDELKAHGGNLPTKEVDAVANALARYVVALVVSPVLPQEEWLTTQEAANRCGFSRPFVATLLDSGAYKGKVIRTTGGHRKVLASEFDALMAQASAEAPKNLAQARKAVDLTRLDEDKAISGKVRKQSRERARAVAKKLGLSA
jgi:hypothetical protein